MIYIVGRDSVLPLVIFQEGIVEFSRGERVYSYERTPCFKMAQRVYASVTVHWDELEANWKSV